MMLGNDLIEAVWIAITHAEDAAVPVAVTRRGLFEGQIMPRTYNACVSSSGSNTRP